MKKVAVHLRTYTVLERAVEEGAKLGVNRAYKHTDNPSRETLAEAVTRAVMECLDEVVDFEK